MDNKFKIFIKSKGFMIIGFLFILVGVLTLFTVNNDSIKIEKSNNNSKLSNVSLENLENLTSASLENKSNNVLNSSFSSNVSSSFSKNSGTGQKNKYYKA